MNHTNLAFSVKSILLTLMLLLPNLLLAQTTYTFYTCGATGQSGPTQNQASTTYSNTSLDGKVTVSNGIQKWVVPSTGLYKITTIGAAGGDISTSCNASGGKGASMSGEFFLKGGDTLKILVGQKGITNGSDGGGGGGSFVAYSNDTPIIVAGGGGGASNNIGKCGSNLAGVDASTSTSGTNGANGGGTGGKNGNGGVSTGGSGGGGGGYYTDGTGAVSALRDGKAFKNGGTGGTGANNDHGGFGGGASGWFTGGQGGGAGGYSGGGTSNAQPFTGGGGGGSYNSGANQKNIASVNSGDGKVEITIMSTNAYNDAAVIGLVSPVKYCPGLRNVNVVVANFGINQIKSLKINWSVDNTNQTTVSYTNTLDTLGGVKSIDTIFIGAYNFGSGTTDLKVWSSDPNSGADTTNDNDTMSVQMVPTSGNPVNFIAHNPFKKGTPFKGIINQGTAVNPDGACLGDTITYIIEPPVGLSNSDYGVKWDIIEFSLSTDKGYSSVNKSIVYPSSSGDGKLTFYPGSQDADSLYLMRVTIQSPEWGCDSTFARYIKAYPLPVASFSATSPACLGTPITFSNTSTASPSIKYKWYLGNGITRNDTNLKYTYSFEGTYTVSLVAYNEGCSDSTTQTIVIQPPVSGVYFKQGGKFDGYFFNGTPNDPDLGCVRDTLTYEIVPPPAFIDSDYGTTWEVTSHSIKTTGGASTSNYSFSAPSASGAGEIIFTPTFAEADLTFILSTSFKALNSSCKDTTIVRYISISTSPTANFNINGQCVGKPTFFTDASTVAPGLVVRRYEFGANNAFATTANPSYTYNTAGEYTVTYTVTGKGGCDDVLKKKITIYDEPTADFDVPSTVCAGNPAAFMSTSTGNGTTITRYKWTFNQGATPDTSNQADVAYTFTNSGSYSISLQVWTDGGCNSSVTKNITVVDAPKAAFPLTKGCVNEPITFVNNSTDAVSYEWRFSDKDTIRTKDAVKTFKFKSSYSVTLVATSASGCRDSVTRQIEFHDQPEVDFTSTGNCAGRPVDFRDATTFPTPSSSAVEWTWTIEGQKKTGDKTTHTFATAGTYNIKLKVKSNYGCTDSFTAPITINAPPVAGMTLPGSACINVASTFENTSTGTGNSYLWHFGDGETSADEKPSHTYDATGTYIVKLVTTNGTGCKDSVTEQLTVGLGPEVPFKWCAKGKVVTFEAENTSYATYEWDFGDILNGTGTGTNPTYTYLAANGEYDVTLTVIDATGCVGIYTTKVGTGTKDNSTNCEIGIEGTTARKLDVNIYPNPFSHQTRIEYELLKSQQVRVTVWDATGKEVAILSNGLQQAGQQQLTLDANEHKLSAGLYMIRIETEGAVAASQVLRLE